MGDDNVIPFPGAGPSADDVRAWAKDLIDQLGSPQAAISALSGFGGLDSGYARFGRRPPLLFVPGTKRFLDLTYSASLQTEVLTEVELACQFGIRDFIRETLDLDTTVFHYIGIIADP